MSNPGLQHWVALANEQRDHAIDIAHKRVALVNKYKRVSHDSHSLSLKRHEDGAIAELAGKVFLGSWAKWNDVEYGSQLSKLPDLEDFIDVKAITQKHHRLMVPTFNKKENVAYLLVYLAHPLYWIRGWLWGHEMTDIEEHDRGRPCYVAKKLHDPELLRDIAMKRRNLYQPPDLWRDKTIK